MESSECCEGESEIASFYFGRHILVTGATGFMGMALVEKLLRTCPDLARLYLLVRPKREQTVQDRMDRLFSNNIFDTLRSKRGNNFYQKVTPIVGDISSLEMGISKEDYTMLTEKLEIIFHVAANVRFNATLVEMTKSNVRGTQCVIDLAKRSPNFKALVHVSTAYSNCVRSDIGEKFYKPAMDPKKLIELVEKEENDALNIMTHKFLGEYPNPYSFSKQIGESLIETCGLPSCVFRPGVVLASANEPVSGWTLGLGGPQAVNVTVLCGILHAAIADSDKKVEYIPVDISINAMLACGWQVGQTQSLAHPRPIVYNNVAKRNPITWGMFTEHCVRASREAPSVKAIWYPEYYITKYNIVCAVLGILMHLLPAILVDGVLLLIGRKPGFLDIYKRIYRQNGMMCHFTLNEWEFEDDNLQSVLKSMNIADQLAFPMDITKIKWREYLKSMVVGVRLNLVRDEIKTLPAAKRRSRILLVVHYLVKYSFMFLILVMLWSRIETILKIRFKNF